MPTTAVSFSRSIAAKSKEIPAVDVVKAHRRIALELQRRIVLRTPVDTGFARSNWQAAVGAANDSIVGTSRNPTTIRARAREALASLPPFSVIVVFNNAPYIGVLESGSSAQAPQGMVAVSLNEVEVLGAVI
jgi:hypothetical protein